MNTRLKKIAILLMVFQLSIPLFSQETKIPEAEINVLVTDFKNNTRKGEQIIFEGKNNKLVFKGISDNEGKLSVKLKGGDTYLIKIKSIGKEQDYNQVSIPKIGPNQQYQKMMLTIKFEPPRTFTLDNVHFDTGKWSIRNSSLKELNELLEYLSLKEDIKIEIGGHTDNVGEESANLQLSQKRADSVKKFLVSKGIAANRISAKGYGESSPIDTNDTLVGKQNNRRTEVRIL